MSEPQQQKVIRERPPHAGQEDCDRGRHEWRYTEHWNGYDYYVCSCCGAEDTD